MADHECSCCEKVVSEGDWDYLYTSCSACAFEHSLEHWPCDHGAAAQAERASTSDQPETK